MKIQKAKLYKLSTLEPANTIFEYTNLRGSSHLRLHIAGSFCVGELAL